MNQLSRFCGQLLCQSRFLKMVQVMLTASDQKERMTAPPTSKFKPKLRQIDERLRPNTSPRKRLKESLLYLRVQMMKPWM